MTSAQLMADMKGRLRKTFRSVYQKGYAEFLSSNYDVVLTVPVAILHKFAEDSEVRNMAEGYLLYKWSLAALNNFDGHVIAPYARQNYQQETEPRDVPPATPVLNWLLWGWGPATRKVGLDLFKLNGTQWTVSAALLNMPLDDIFNQLAGNSLAPFEHVSSASTFGVNGTGVPHMMMRKVYRDRLFAIGTGNFRWVPGGDYADQDAVSFNIVWSSADRFRYLECNQPYWTSDGETPDRHPDSWEKGSISPFQQTAHHENTAIVLYNIPEKDPWPGAPSPSKWAWRDGHAEKLLARGQFRYPKSVDETVEKGGWIFLREGQVYIAAKPLRDYYIQTNLTNKDANLATLTKGYQVVALQETGGRPLSPAGLGGDLEGSRA
jgi:hypothetical protein